MRRRLAAIASRAFVSAFSVHEELVARGSHSSGETIGGTSILFPTPFAPGITQRTYHLTRSLAVREGLRAMALDGIPPERELT